MPQVISPPDKNARSPKGGKQYRSDENLKGFKFHIREGAAKNLPMHPDPRDMLGRFKVMIQKSHSAYCHQGNKGKIPGNFNSLKTKQP